MTAKNSKQTSTKAASASGKVLTNKTSTKPEKTAAASALSQTPAKAVPKPAKKAAPKKK